MATTIREVIAAVNALVTCAEAVDAIKAERDSVRLQQDSIVVKLAVLTDALTAKQGELSVLIANLKAML